MALWGGASRGYGPWLLAGAALGACFALRTGARFDALAAQYDSRLVRLTACVEDVQPGYTRATVRARLRVEEAGGVPAAFCCQCDALPLCEAGERVEGWFRLEAPSPADQPDYRADGVAFLAEYERRFVRLGPGRSFRAWSARLQTRLADALCQSLDGDEAGALAAMIVGDRTRITSELNSAYRRAGLSHVLVVSGMHVTILCGMGLPRRWSLQGLLRAGRALAACLPGRAGVRLHRALAVRLALMELGRPRPDRAGWHPEVLCRQRLAALWPVALAVLLAGVTGFTPSVLRAGAAVAIGAAGVWLHAPADALTSLALAGLVMGAQNSYAACDIGFELSFAAVAGTLAGAAVARRALRAAGEDRAHRGAAARLRRALARALVEAACIAVCASAAAFPVLVLRGLSTSPYALLSGVAVLWVVQPMMVLGIAAALAGMAPALGPVYRLCAAGAGLLVRLLNAWVRMVGGWPAAEIGFDGGYAAFVCLALMGLCALAWRWRIRLRALLPGLALALAVGVGAGAALNRDVVQVALVGGARTPSVILAQNGQAVVLYRGGSSGRTAVERWLTRHGIDQAGLLVDLRGDPARAGRPEAGRTITAARLGDYTDYTAARGDIEVEVVCTRGGRAVRVTVGRWQLAAEAGDFALAQPVSVDWLLAGPAEPAAFRWQGAVAPARYDWMPQDAPLARGLLLRPEGGALPL